ncbi:M48 family metallopeptidase [Roseateles sp.]|uniref:M48 family metallopeptidase n=1 Tax=Roseateles sp. TaxID=1971397 RepID=UPI002F3FC17A
MNEQTVADPSPPTWVVAGAAVAASAFFQLLLLLPCAVAMAIPIMFYGANNTVLIWGGLGFVLLAWLVQPDWRLSLKTLRRDEAPGLYAKVDALTDALQAPRVHEIALDASINAGALERHRGLSLRPTRRVLVLGLPLLRLLDEAAAEAVIAHELGHFSRRHGRLGHWVYRTRAAWSSWARTERLSMDEDVESSSPWERAGRNFAAMFLPWFRRASEAHSRRCEFEADALAARLASPRALGRALLLIERASVRQARTFEDMVRERLALDVEPPADWVEWAPRALTREPVTAAEVAELLQHRQPRGSHPTHAARLAALGCDPSDLDLTPAGADECAGARWLGASWDAQCRSHSPWAGESQRLRWTMGHAALAGTDRTQWPMLSVEVPRRDAAARRLRQRRLWEAGEALQKGRVQVHALTPWQQDALRHALAANPLIGQAWAFEAPLPEAEGGGTMLCLVMRIDPEGLRARHLTEDDVLDQVQTTADLLWPAGREWGARLSYMTEGLPPDLQARVDATPRLKG